MPLAHYPDALNQLFATQHGLVTSRQAQRLGLSRAAAARRERAGQLDRPFSTVLRLKAVPRTWEQDVLAAVLATSCPVAASHRAATALHLLDGCAPGMVELSVSSRYRVELPGVVVHHVDALDPQDLLTIRGIPCTGLARTLADLGSVVAPAVVERALDDARRRGVNLQWLEETATRLHRPGQSGTGVLLRLLAEAREMPAVRGSWFEKLVEDCLRSPALPPIVRQHSVYDPEGRLAGILDLAFPSIRLGVEAHSRQFHFGHNAEHRDEDRDHRLARCGWEVLYVGWQSTRRPADLIALVVDTARHRRRLLRETEV
jgi:very-short-patch-repair endonuclease